MFFPKKNDIPFQMPLYKNNKRLFLNELEKFTNDLLNQFEDLDLSKPNQELSDIPDAHSEEMLSEQKTFMAETNVKKEGQRNPFKLPLLSKQKSSFFPFSAELFHERRGYKNYKYMYFDLDYDELIKAKKLGKKFDLEKHLNHNFSAEEPPEPLKRRKYLNLSKRKLKQEFSFLKKNGSEENEGGKAERGEQGGNVERKGVKRDKLAGGRKTGRDGGKRGGGVRKLEGEIAEENDEMREGRGNFEETRLISTEFLADKNQKSYPLILPILERKEMIVGERSCMNREGEMKRMERGGRRKNRQEEGAYGRIKLLAEMTRKKGSPSVKFQSNNNSDITIIENMGGKRRREGEGERIEMELNNLKIAEILSRFKKLKGMKRDEGRKGGMSKRNLEEFLAMCVENENTGKKEVYLRDLKLKYEIFKKNDKDINNRIILALDLNPFSDTTKLDWESFIRFKRIVIQNDSTLQENVEFLVNYFNLDKRDRIKVEDFSLILRNLCYKLDSDTDLENMNRSLYDYLIENLHLTGCICSNNENLIMEKFKKALIDTSINYKFFFDLIFGLY